MYAYSVQVVSRAGRASVILRSLADKYSAGGDNVPAASGTINLNRIAPKPHRAPRLMLEVSLDERKLSSCVLRECQVQNYLATPACVRSAKGPANLLPSIVLFRS